MTKTQTFSSNLRGFTYTVYDIYYLGNKTINDYMKEKKWNILQWPSASPDFNPIK